MYLKTAFTLISSLLPVYIIVYALIRVRKGIAFLKKSKTARAVVVKTNVEAAPDGDAYYLVVRFQTEQQEWITQQLKTPVAGILPEGKEVNVIYDPQNPTHVEIDSRVMLVYVPLFFIATAVLYLTLTFLKYLGILTVGSGLAEG